MLHVAVAVHAEMPAYLDAMVELSASSYDIVHLNTTHFLPFAFAPALPGAVTGTLHCPPYESWPRAAQLPRDRRASPSPPSRQQPRSWRRHVDIDGCWPTGRPGPLATWTGREGAVWVGSPRAGEGARPRHRGSPPRRHAAALIGPIHDRRYFAADIEPHLGGDICTWVISSADAAALAVGAARRRGHPGVGRAVRPGDRRGAGVWHPGCRVRPRRGARPRSSTALGVVTEHEDPPCSAQRCRRGRLDRRACRQHAEATSISRGWSTTTRSGFWT